MKRAPFFGYGQDRIGRLALAVVLLAPAVLLARADAADAPLAAPVDACIRGNAAGVEAAIPDLSQGVDFLVGNLCAEPIATEQARQSKIDNDRRTAKLKAACDARKPHPGKPDDKDYMSLMCSYQIGVLTETNNDDDQDVVTAYVGFSGVGGGRPPAAAALAARLLLDLRLAHLKLPVK
jgi:hypothetical protein